MPVTKGSNGKYRIGKGRAIYPTKAAAEKAQRGMYAARGRKKKGK
jgi:hypothetical protein